MACHVLLGFITFFGHKVMIIFFLQIANSYEGKGWQPVNSPLKPSTAAAVRKGFPQRGADLL